MSKMPGPPKEVCEYCLEKKVCTWTVHWHSAEYAMCNDCVGEAQKDFFSYHIRHLKP